MSQKKVFRDPIYGLIELHLLLVVIIDTPEFQRLRHIKQLGGKCYVYPAASHCRFEHSIGVCHLAGNLIRKLRNDQPELNITTEEILIVEIAGLCHDLGHGPFSHLWDQRFQTETKHEKVSQMLLKQVFKNDKVKDTLKEYKITCENEELVQRACDLIKREDVSKPKPREFLYEIVDSPNDIDVDKWDYFTRDCHYLGLKHGFDLWRLLETARVIDGHIAYRDKAIYDIKEMFHTRTVLHEKAYQHKTGCAVEMMIADAFKKAEEGNFLFKCAYKCQQNFKTTCKISEATKEENLGAFLALKDDVLVEQIKYESELDRRKVDQNPHIQKAGELLRRVDERDLYTLVHEFEFETKMPEKDTKDTTDPVLVEAGELLRRVDDRVETKMPEKDTTEKKKTDQLPKSKDRIMKWLGKKRPLPDNCTVDVSEIEDKLDTTKITIYKKRKLDPATSLEGLQDIIIPKKKATKVIVRAFYKGTKAEWKEIDDSVKQQIPKRFNKKEFEKWDKEHPSTSV